MFGDVRFKDAVPVGERNPIFDPTGEQWPEQDVMVEVPEGVKDVLG